LDWVVGAARAAVLGAQEAERVEVAPAAQVARPCGIPMRPAPEGVPADLAVVAQDLGEERVVGLAVRGVVRAVEVVPAAGRAGVVALEDLVAGEPEARVVQGEVVDQPEAVEQVVGRELGVWVELVVAERELGVEWVVEAG